MLRVTLKILLFLTQISRLLFLTQISASRLQPLDAGITRNFKVKYRKRLLKFVISQIDDTRKAFEIIEEVDVLKAISWIKAAWEEVSDQTVTNCFVSVVFVTRLKMELCKH